MHYNRALLFGHWYRKELTENGIMVSESALLSPDGSYEFSFIQYDHHGDIIEQSVELGDWGLVGDIHFTIAKNEYVDEQLHAADLTNDDNYHAYQVIDLNSQIFKYQHVITKEVFILRRVIDKIGHC